MTETLLQCGADVVSTDMQTEPQSDIWQPLISLAKKNDGKLHYFACDVTDEKQVADVFEQAEGLMRYPLKGLVTCAGVSGRCPAVDYPVHAFRKIMDINVTGTFLCATAAAKIMQRQGVPGSIVLFASMSGTNVNKVDRDVQCATDQVAEQSRASTLVRTTLPNRLCFSLLAIWRQNGATVLSTRPSGSVSFIRRWKSCSSSQVNTISPGYIMTPSALTAMLPQ